MKQKEIWDFDHEPSSASELPRVFTVHELTRYIKERLEYDERLNNVWVRGEISNLKYHSSGNTYFTLKDEFSQLRCVIFSRVSVGFRFEDGMRIITRGNIGIYERRGEYQLYIEEAQPDGIGTLHIAFEQLKKRLGEEGLFDEEYKQKISILPQKIGIITSPTGAVIRDMLNIIGRRFPNVHILIAPVLVQGEGASRDIARAIALMNTQDVDVIIIGRGGGSLEELWAFNEEIVARAIFDSRIPIISAVGHETDFTIADFVADVRAPTPSTAAEMVVPDKRELIRHLDSMRIRMEQRMMMILESHRSRSMNIKQSIAFRKPKEIIYQERQRMDEFMKKLSTSIMHQTEIKKERLHALSGKLDALSPLKILGRGYIIALKLPEEDIVRSVEDINVGNRMKMLISDGEIICNVEDKKAGRTKWKR
jgi:exodeoxyribonuclease VII large subunit